MPASSSAQPAAPANPEPLIVRVHNKGEKEAFLTGRRHVLNECQVWWEDTDKVTDDLLTLLDPYCPCTRIHPCYLDLGLRFPLSQMWKEILMHFQIGPYFNICTHHLLF